MAGDAIANDLEAGGGGVALPLFGGTLVEDWKSHQLRLEAWFRIRSITLDSTQATDCLFLSLKGYAALVYQRVEESERSTYEKGVGWLTAYFVNETRTRLVRSMAYEKLDARTYRGKGKRSEFVMDLVQELEMLFFQAGIQDQDEAKRRAFIQCFNECVELKHRLEISTTTYAEAIDLAMQWESTRVEFQSSDIPLHAQSGNNNVATTKGSSISSHHSSFFSAPESKKLQSSIEASRTESTTSAAKPCDANADTTKELLLVSSLLEEQGQSRPTSSFYFSDQILCSRSLLDNERPSAPLLGGAMSTTTVPHLVSGPLSSHSREHLVVAGAGADREQEEENVLSLPRRSSPAASSQFSMCSLPSEIRQSIQSSRHAIVVSNADSDERRGSPSIDLGVDPERRSDSRVDQEQDGTESSGLRLEHTTISPLDSIATPSIPGSNSSFIQGTTPNRSLVSSNRFPLFDFEEPHSLRLNGSHSPPPRSSQHHGGSQSAVEFYYGQFGAHDIEGVSFNRLTDSDLPSTGHGPNAQVTHGLSSTYDSIAAEIVGGIVTPTSSKNTVSDLPGALESRRSSDPGFNLFGDGQGFKGEKGPLVRLFRFSMFEASSPIARLCSPDGVEGEEEIQQGMVVAQEVGPRSSADSIRPPGDREESSNNFAADDYKAITTPTQDLIRNDLGPNPHIHLAPQQTINTRRHRSLFTLGISHPTKSGGTSTIARHRHVRGTPRKLAKNLRTEPPSQCYLVVASSSSSTTRSRQQHKHTKTMSLDRILWRTGGGEVGRGTTTTPGRSHPNSSSLTTTTSYRGSGVNLNGVKRSSKGWKGLWGRWFYGGGKNQGEPPEGMKEEGFHVPFQSLSDGKRGELGVVPQSPRLPEMDLGEEVRVRQDGHRDGEDEVEELEEVDADVHGGEGRPAKERRGLMMMETRF
ncbi:BQ2448_1149 [Microbotryum intermedium]|uniref:BQ2448_1149 protein n=1 Tax=Microbotryum intermedium TaxID=269621 RepID=A0A238F978_9BASI|nr:BQ2448_1149 [Microbotryum intermedium]